MTNRKPLLVEDLVPGLWIVKLYREETDLLHKDNFGVLLCLHRRCYANPKYWIVENMWAKEDSMELPVRDGEVRDEISIWYPAIRGDFIRAKRDLITCPLVVPEEDPRPALLYPATIPLPVSAHSQLEASSGEFCDGCQEIVDIFLSVPSRGSDEHPIRICEGCLHTAVTSFISSKKERWCLPRSES